MQSKNTLEFNMGSFFYRFILIDKDDNETEYFTDANTPSIALHNIIETYQINLNDYIDVYYDDVKFTPKVSGFRDFGYKFKECGWGENQPKGRKYLDSYDKNLIEDIYGSVEIDINGTKHRVKRETLKKLLGT